MAGAQSGQAFLGEQLVDRDKEPTEGRSEQPGEEAERQATTHFRSMEGGIRPTGRFVGEKKPADPTSGESLRVADSSASISAAAADVLSTGEIVFLLKDGPPW